MKRIFGGTVFSILNLTIVKEYYRQNAVFIFAILMFSFGFLRAEEHKTIIKSALNLPSLLLLVFIGWGLHAAKVILFTLRMFESKQNEFLYNIRLFSPMKRFLAFGIMQLSLLQLTLLYSLWMIKIGIEEGQYWQTSSIIICNVFLIFAGILFYEYRLKRPNAISISTKPIQGFLSRFRTPNYLFFVRYLFAKQPVLLLLSKLFSCFILVGICTLYPTDAYDERLLAIGGLFVAAGHTVFCQEFLYFENQFLLISRNLPINHSQRLWSYLRTYLILLLPEIIVLIRNLPEGVSYLFVIYLACFILSMIFLNHHTQYINGISNETYMQRVFITGILLLLLIMYKIPVILIALVNFFIAFYVFKKHYYEIQST